MRQPELEILKLILSDFDQEFLKEKDQEILGGLGMAIENCVYIITGKCNLAPNTILEEARKLCGS